MTDSEALLKRSPEYGALSMTKAQPDEESPQNIIKRPRTESKLSYSWWKSTLDLDAVHFGIRMAVTMTVSSLFVLIRSPEGESLVPQGLWVLITVLFVSWFPSLDAASVVKKSLQRLAGTVVGACLGLLSGFLSLLMPSSATQAVFLGCSMALVTFGVIFSAMHIRVSKTNTLFQEFNYGAILCLLTFSISVFPFYTTDDPKWVRSVYRIMNVVIGCVIGCLGSILVLPRSTNEILLKKMRKQIKLAGESSEAVLHGAADTFSGIRKPIMLEDEALETSIDRRSRLQGYRKRQSYKFVKREVIDDEGDVALDKCESAIKDWKETKALFKITAYDPFNIGASVRSHTVFHTEAAHTLARALRLQTTVVLLDGIVRNEPHHDLDEDHLSLFTNVGTLIRQMLTVPHNDETCGAAAENLTKKLPQIRHLIGVMSEGLVDALGDWHYDGTDYSHNVTKSFRKRVSIASDDSGGRGFPEFVRSGNATAHLFVQLLEHLVLRALKLYKSWKKVEESFAKVSTPSE